MKFSNRVFPILIILLCVASVVASGQDRSMQIRIPVSSPGGMRRIAALGIALDHPGGRSGKWLDLFVSRREADLLRAKGITFTTLIEDWSAYYAARRASDRAIAVPASPKEAQDFHLGSMGGYLTWAEVVAELDSMHAKYPTLITPKDSIGSTLQHRAIWAVKISKNAAVDVAEPRVLYAALIHAREPEALMQMIYFMWYLLQNYGTDPEVTSILGHRELSFIPVYNADGYVYNQTTDSTGGGLWRKNMRMNSDGSRGVDLNRNYGFQWGYDDFGSSPIGGSEVYRGTGPFSEPETQAIRDFCMARGFTIALNYHSYSDALVYPWGFSDADTKDSLLYWSLSDGLTSVNHYLSGTGTQTVGYTTNGDSDDWGYGDTLSKPRIFSLTPEVGDNYDGFWPVPSRILPIARQNLVANLYAAHAAGEYITIATQSVKHLLAGDSVRIDLTFVNKGFAESSSTVDLSISSTNLDFSGDSLHGLPWKNGTPVSILGHVTHDAPGPVAVAVEISYQGGMTLDTLTFYLGPVDTVYADGAEGTRERWMAVSTTGVRWDTTSADAHSGKYSFSDSPGGNYLDNEVSTFTLDSALVLAGRAAELRFWTKWAIETHYDYATVEVSTNDGVTWLPLQGKFSSQGSGYGVQLPQYSPGYDGIRHGWEEESIDLWQFTLQTIKIRFRLASDQGYTRDGMDVDDIHVLVYPIIDAVNDRPGLSHAFALEQNFPNPFNPTTLVSYQLPVAGTVRLVVYDILGREVATLVNEKKPAGSYVARFNGSTLSSGVYFCRLSANSFVLTRKMMLLK